MLTTEKLLTLLNYERDEALFTAAGTAAERQLMAGIDWNKYANLLQDLLFVSKKISFR